MDISDRKMQQQNMTLNNNKLQQENADKNKLFSIIGHDLKFALISIKGFSESTGR